MRRCASPLVLALAVLATACGGSSDGDDAQPADDGEAEQAPGDLVGFRIEPLPEVGDVTLPDLTDSNAEFTLEAAPGELLLVYFGYTNCPDFCPGTLANVKLARQRLEQPDQVDLAMVTVDPERDLPVLADYVTSFVSEGHALGTEDPDRLARAAQAFGVAYEVRQVDGETQVGHSTALYAVDNTGHVVLTWPFGVTIDEMASDFEILLGEE